MNRQFFVDQRGAMSHNLDNWKARGSKRVRTGWAVFFICLSLILAPTCLADSSNDFPGKGSRAAWERGNTLSSESIDLAKQNKIAEAIAASQRAISVYPFEGTYHYNLGIIFLNMKRDFANAARCFEKAGELDPQDDKAWYNLGLAYRGLKNNKMAEAGYRKALSVKPDKFEALYNLGNVLRDEGRFDDARAAYDRASKLSDANSNAMKDAYRELEEVVSKKKGGGHK